MKCVICKSGETRPGAVSVTLEREGLTLVIKAVPAQVCGNCGEQYLDEAATARLLSEAEEALRAGVQVEIRAFRAAWRQPRTPDPPVRECRSRNLSERLQ